MPTADELLAMIRRCGWPELRALWEGVKLGVTPDWQPGKAFEYLVLRAFELDGGDAARVRYPYFVDLFEERIEEIDGAVHLNGLSCLIESKDHERNLSAVPIAKMRSQLLRRPAGTLGSVFSAGDFSQPAKVLAQFMMPQAILLWTGVEVDRIVAEEKVCEFLRLKLARCAETGDCAYNIAGS